MVMNKYIKTYNALLSLEEFLELYYPKTYDSWYEFQKNVNDAFNIKTKEEYDVFLKEFWVQKLDCKYMKEFYEKIKIELNFFDDDILRFIAFIAGLGYFQKIGNPSLDIWLNAKDLHHPFDKYEEYEGFSLLEVLNLKNGDNAIRNTLSTAIKIIHGGYY